MNTQVDIVNGLTEPEVLFKDMKEGDFGIITKGSPYYGYYGELVLRSKNSVIAIGKSDFYWSNIETCPIKVIVVRKLKIVIEE